MSSQRSIQIDSDANRVLSYAYRALLSMRNPDKTFKNYEDINEAVLYALVAGTTKPKACSYSKKFSCEITVEKLTSSTSLLNIYLTPHGSIRFEDGFTGLFVSDFLNRFTNLLHNEQNQ